MRMATIATQKSGALAERPREGFENDVDRRPRHADRFAQIEMPDIDEVAAELLDQGIIEPVPLAKGVAGLERSIERQIEVRGITRQPRQEEDEDDQADERDGAG
jgi:hypothetical protein